MNISIPEEPEVGNLLQIEYEISEQDFINGQSLAIKNSPVRLIRWTRLVIPLFGVVLLVFLVYTVKQQSFSWRMIPGLAAVLVFVALPLLNRRTQRSLYAKATGMHGKLCLGLDENGLRFQGPTFSSQANWSNFCRFFEDERSFVLYQNQRVFNIVPKRGLAPEQITALRGYLERNIGRTAAR